jgi:peptide/nickel transport system permease protein
MEAVSESRGLPSRAQESRLSRWALVLRRHPQLGAGLAILLVLVITLALVQVLTPYDPLRGDPSVVLEPPSQAHVLGTDSFGRDILSRIAEGAWLDLPIAFATVAIAITVGLLIGALAGYMGGLVDMAVMRATDILMAFPSFILAMVMVAVLGNSVPTVVVAIAAAFVPDFIRLLRGEVLSEREMEYVDAARCAGNSEWRIMYVQLLPNCMTPVLVHGTLCLAWAILDVAGLAFLGIGITPPTPEWGVLVSEGVRYTISGDWWVSLFPGATILLAALGFNLVGDSLRDITATEERGQ